MHVLPEPVPFPKTMKILHFADAHIGADNRGRMDPQTGLSLRVHDFLDALDEIINTAYDEDVDLALFAGDAFHTKNPPADIQTAFAERIYDLAKQCPVVLLVGNHDLGQRDSTALNMYDALRAPNIIVGNNYEILHIDTKAGVVHVATFPYPTRRLLGASDWKERATKTKEQIAILSEDAEQYDPVIFLGHITVMGARYGSEQHIAFVDRAVVGIEDLASGPWCYVALGHFHYHQELWQEPPIVYAGSIERVTYNEEKDDKGCCIVEITDTDVGWKFVSSDPRPMISIDIDLHDEVDPTSLVVRRLRRERNATADAICRVTMSMRKSDVQLVDTNEIFKQLEGHAFSYELRFDTTEDSRDVRRFSKDIVTMTEMQILEEYLDPIISNDSEYNAVLDLAEEIMREA